MFSVPSYGSTLCRCSWILFEYWEFEFVRIMEMVEVKNLWSSWHWLQDSKRVESFQHCRAEVDRTKATSQRTPMDFQGCLLYILELPEGKVPDHSIIILNNADQVVHITMHCAKCVAVVIILKFMTLLKSEKGKSPYCGYFQLNRWFWLFDRIRNYLIWLALSTTKIVISNFRNWSGDTIAIGVEMKVFNCR